MPRRAHKLFEVETTEEGLVIIPYSFTVNNTSDADGLSDSLESATLSEAGEYLLAFRDRFAAVAAAPPPNIHNTADDVDLYAKIQTDTLVSAGTATVRCMTGATQTTPTNDTIVSGVIIAKKTTRSARG